MEQTYFIIAAVIALSYLLGSVAFGLVLTKLAGLEDIRNIGSGNIGATNVLRTGRKDLAALTLILDAGKGAIAALLAGYFAGEAYMAMAGAAAFLGHCFPVFLKFKGGKGVATFMGTLVAIHPLMGLLAIATWLASAFIFRISSLSALIASMAAPIYAAYFMGYALNAFTAFLWVAFMTIMIFIRHKENIARLLKGQEPKIGKKSS